MIAYGAITTRVETGMAAAAQRKAQIGQFCGAGHHRVRSFYNGPDGTHFVDLQ